MRYEDSFGGAPPFRLGDGDRLSGRRAFLKCAAAAGAGLALPGVAWPQATQPATQPAARTRLRMARFPEKTDLILLTDRPPNLETPLRHFRHDLTPNEAFFVRWHYSGIPTEVDATAFRLSIGGHVQRALSVSLDELRSKFQPVSLVAVAQCSGNSRAYFEPRVNGGQWGHGAVGNAKWTGVRLRDLLEAAAVKDGAVDVTFGALDRPINPDAPAYVKSLPIQRAADGEVMVAYAMNDAPLPMLNGFPLRLVVPGWYATYWVKALSEINVLPAKFEGFWMKTAYRIPNNADAQEAPGQLATDTVPIHAHSVRSIIVAPEPAARVKAGAAADVEGVALDGGQGITRVDVSTDGGATWHDATLGVDLGKYSWRRWQYRWQPRAAGTFRLMARATNAAGQTQTTRQWNRSGYQRNVVEHVDVTVA